jgi:hypothetical protein
VADRRAFLATVASAGVGFSLAAPDAAAAQSPSPLPPPSPAASAAAKAPSAGAAALAAAMRRFDPALTPAECDTIARGIDANLDTAAQLNPKKKRLKNSDEPDVRFAVPGGAA